MEYLIAVAYPSAERAAEVPAALHQPEAGAHVDLENAVYASRDGAGRLELRQRIGQV